MIKLTTIRLAEPTIDAKRDGMFSNETGLRVVRMIMEPNLTGPADWIMQQIQTADIHIKKQCADTLVTPMSRNKVHLIGDRLVAEQSTFHW